jgi:serine/threonine protein kinase
MVPTKEDSLLDGFVNEQSPGVGRHSTDQRLKDFQAILGPALRKGDLGSLDGYRVKKLLGMGGMGCVFLGEDTRLSREVALKVMRPGEVSKHAALDRFMLEGRAAASIKNDHVVTIHQVGDARGVVYMAMELLRGTPLDKWLEKQAANGGVQALNACRIARDTLKGLAAAHEVGLVHRDIKPSNLWLEEGTGRVKILDFGLTRANQHDGTLTQEGMLVGTPAYMSPEQALGKLVTPRSDLFSLGTVLYQALGGENPFLRDSVAATLGAIVNKAQARLVAKRPHVPAELSAFVDRLLAKNPNNRPASAALALRELQEVDRLVRITSVSTQGSRQPATTNSPIKGMVPQSKAPTTNTADPGFQPMEYGPDGSERVPEKGTTWTTGRKVAIAAGCGAVLSLGLFLTGRGNRQPASPPAANQAEKDASPNPAAIQPVSSTQSGETLPGLNKEPAPSFQSKPLEPRLTPLQAGTLLQRAHLDNFRHQNPGITFKCTWNDRQEVETLRLSGAFPRNLEALANLTSLREISAEPASDRDPVLNLSQLKGLSLDCLRLPGRRVSGLQDLAGQKLVELEAALGSEGEKLAWINLASLRSLNGKTHISQSGKTGESNQPVPANSLVKQEPIAKTSPEKPSNGTGLTTNLRQNSPPQLPSGSDQKTADGPAQQSSVPPGKNPTPSAKKKPAPPPRGVAWINGRMVDLAEQKGRGTSWKDTPLPPAILRGLRFGNDRQPPGAGQEVATTTQGRRKCLWPEELDGPAYRQVRDGLEREHRLGWIAVSNGKSPRAHAEAGRNFVAIAQQCLARDAGLVTPDEYCRAKRFLSGMEQEFKAMAGENPNIVLAGQWVPDPGSVKTIGQLATFMADRSISLADTPEGSRRSLDDLVHLIDGMAKSNPGLFRQLATVSPATGNGD